MMTNSGIPQLHISGHPQPTGMAQPVAPRRNRENNAGKPRSTVRSRNRTSPSHHVAFQDGPDQRLPSPCAHDATRALEARGFGSSTPMDSRATQPRVAPRLCHPGEKVGPSDEEFGIGGEDSSDGPHGPAGFHRN